MESSDPVGVRCRDVADVGRVEYPQWLVVDPPDDCIDLRLRLALEVDSRPNSCVHCLRRPPEC